MFIMCAIDLFSFLGGDIKKMNIFKNQKKNQELPSLYVIGKQCILPQGQNGSSKVASLRALRTPLKALTES